MNGFTDEERLSYKSLIYNNTFHGIKTIVTAARDLGIDIADEKNKVIKIISVIEMQCSFVGFERGKD
jgi:hypothetical protein